MDAPYSDGSFPGDVPSATPEFSETGSATESVAIPEPSAAYTPAPRPGMLVFALAGLQAGVVGVFWMVGCFFVVGLLTAKSTWSVLNLFSTVFYGGSAWQEEFLKSSWAGLALIVVLYGLLGVVWGCFWKERRHPLLPLFGALTGLAASYLFFHLIWPRADPWLSLYAPERELQLAHVLWGIALARSPRYALRINSAITRVG